MFLSGDKDIKGMRQKMEEEIIEVEIISLGAKRLGNNIYGEQVQCPVCRREYPMSSIPRECECKRQLILPRN